MKSTDFRRFLFKITGNRLNSLDTRIRERSLSDVRRQIWFMDQYKNPHESKHTIGEVLSWFDRINTEFINSVPKAKAFTPFSSGEQLFKANPRGTAADHFFTQLGMLVSGGKEGGFFIMIGHKKLNEGT